MTISESHASHIGRVLNARAATYNIHSVRTEWIRIIANLKILYLEGLRN